MSIRGIQAPGGGRRLPHLLVQMHVFYFQVAVLPQNLVSLIENQNWPTYHICTGLASSFNRLQSCCDSKSAFDSSVWCPRRAIEDTSLPHGSYSKHPSLPASAPVVRSESARITSSTSRCRSPSRTERSRRERLGGRRKEICNGIILGCLYLVCSSNRVTR